MATANVYAVTSSFYVIIILLVHNREMEIERCGESQRRREREKEKKTE